MLHWMHVWQNPLHQQMLDLSADNKEELCVVMLFDII